ncbi:hypothetical protein G6F50_015385 [Rhizopus delemar]|uniref:Uncharacterized protein n=1 Tax=Rhizopus delemar TaxID=936053 RepID=A0A9P7C4B4_9FUNG|nr:hypothetical protein G6F50_015385 [Rhizopus delemar]
MPARISNDSEMCRRLALRIVAATMAGLPLLGESARCAPPGGPAGRTGRAACAGVQSAGLRAARRAGHGGRRVPAPPPSGHGRLGAAGGQPDAAAGRPGLCGDGAAAAGRG